jgi:abortive infection bacteriophage resistance protein
MSKIYEVKLENIKNNFYTEEVIDIADYETLHFTFNKIPVATNSMKKPYTMEEMVNKLESNQMYFNDEEKEDCAAFLKCVNYYTFKYYAQIEFGKKEVKPYKAVKEIYIFNQYIRNWLHDLLAHIEVFLRTSIVDILAQTYDSKYYQSAQFYIDEDIYFEETGKRSRKKKDRIIGVHKLLESFGNTIRDNIKRNIAIKHHQETYGATPAWLLFDLLTFGQVSTFFNYLIPKYKKRVAQGLVIDKENNMIPSDILASWINALRHLRNVVSHTGKIYGSNFDILPQKHIKDESFMKDLEKFNYDKRIITYLLIMKRIFMLMPPEMQLYWNDKVSELFKEIEHNQHIKPARLGFNDQTFDYLHIK